MQWVDSSIADFAIGYAVQIHQLRVLEIRRRAIEGPSKVRAYDLSELDQHSPLYVRMERLAVRALYTLGLDSGEVILTPLGSAAVRCAKSGTAMAKR